MTEPIRDYFSLSQSEQKEIRRTIFDLGKCPKCLGNGRLGMISEYPLAERVGADPRPKCLACDGTGSVIKEEQAWHQDSML